MDDSRMVESKYVKNNDPNNDSHMMSPVDLQNNNSQNIFPDNSMNSNNGRGHTDLNDIRLTIPEGRGNEQSAFQTIKENIFSKK